MRVVVVEVLHGFLLLATLLVEEVSGDVMEVNELTACFCCHLTIPFSVRIVAAFYLTVRPFITWCQRNQNGRGALFADILNELLQIPAKGIDHLVAAYLCVGFQLLVDDVLFA